jgi:hypothetical protein
VTSSLEPVAWAAINDDGDIAWIGYTQEAAADGVSGRPVVPLYRSPTLTDEEREAIKTAIEWSPFYAHPAAVTLRGLLERTK